MNKYSHLMLVIFKAGMTIEDFFFPLAEIFKSRKSKKAQRSCGTYMWRDPKSQQRGLDTNI